MRLAPVLVVCSFLLSGAVIFAALGATLGMSNEFARYRAEWTRAIFLLPLIAICAWPWLVAFVRAFGEHERRSAILFSVAGVLLAALFYSPISTAPAEGVGYMVIFFVLLAWIAYPLSLFVSWGVARASRQV